jgi:hypothetical protein
MSVLTEMYALLEARPFKGDFDRLPFEAAMRFGKVPEYPTSSDFHTAVSAAGDLARDGDAAAAFHIEAMKWRLKHGGASLTDRRLYRAVAKRLHRARVQEATSYRTVTPSRPHTMFDKGDLNIKNFTGGKDVKLFATKKKAVAYAKAHGWSPKNATKAFNRFWTGYVVGQQINTTTYRVLTDDGPVDLKFSGQKPDYR